MVGYRCDQNGNVLSTTQGGDYPARTVQYDASNRPVAITAGAYTDWFNYDSNGQRAFERLRQVDGSGSVLAETVIRRGPRGFEGESTSINVPGSNRTMRHELGDATVILRTTDGAGGTLSNGRNVEVYYRHSDRLGSPLALSDSTRAFRQTGASATTRRAFDAFGQTRNADFSDRTQPPQVGSLGLAPATRNGFTGHEHLDTLGLIHMNGRVYDYRLGRFLSVDPIIQNPAHSQSLNPYSYIGNNPLSGTDPTGYAACTGSHIDRGEGTDCREQGVDTSVVNSPQAGPSARVQRSGADHQTPRGAQSTATSNSPADIAATNRTPAQHDPSRPSGRSDDATGLDQIVVTPNGSHLREYRVAFELDLYPGWLVEINAWRDRRATAIVNHDAAQIGTMLGKGAAGAGFCAVTAGGCVLMGAYNTAGDIEQGNYGMAVVDGGLTIAGGAGVVSSVRRGTGSAVASELGTAKPTLERPSVIAVDSKGNAIPLRSGEYLTGSKDGRWIQVRDANGNPTGMRIDGPHSPKTHSDPRALEPHAHVPGVTNEDGTPWLPIYK